MRTSEIRERAKELIARTKDKNIPEEKAMALTVVFAVDLYCELLARIDDLTEAVKQKK